MTMQSCIYEGTVRHRRFAPVGHEFRQSLFLLYLDLQELPALFEEVWLWSAERPSLAWFRRQDHLGPDGPDLQEAVKDRIESHSRVRPGGPVRLLTHLRYAGFFMNPICLYYCFDEQDELQFVVAEVNNTPWGEQCSYVLDVRQQGLQDTFTVKQPKQMHVSPFLGMEYDYLFRFNRPHETLTVHIENCPQSGESINPLFDATMTLQRRPMTRRALNSLLWRYPLMSFQVYAGIYWQAFRLWMKKAPYFPHPVQSEVSAQVDHIPVHHAGDVVADEPTSCSPPVKRGSHS